MKWAKVFVTVWLASVISENCFYLDHPNALRPVWTYDTWGFSFFVMVVVLIGLWWE